MSARFATLLIPFAQLLAVSVQPLPASDDVAFFEKRIRPVLVEHCYPCHSAQAFNADRLKGGLLLDSRAGLRHGGDSGPAVVPNRPADSLLMSALRHESYEMPPNGKLPDNVIADFKEWIERGAPDPRTEPTPERASQSGSQVQKSWAFQPIDRKPPPTVQLDGWARGDVDRFILANLERAELEPVRDADRRTLLRRLYVDLTGLPPSAEEVDAFARSRQPHNVTEVVDRLLASPRFGERWGRHWLDVVRYADSVGGGANVVFDDAWRYRDYVIRSFNSDKPFDLFVREQVAGDLLPVENENQRREQLIATGFLALGPKELAEYDMVQLQWDTVDEQIDTLGKSLLGMTLGCARCHDHKFDAISTRDYYALAGIFRSTETLLPKRSGVIVQWTRLPLPGAQKESALGVAEAASPGDCHICVRGNKDQPGPTVPRGFPQSFQLKVPVQITAEQSGRLELAGWLTHPDHPLTARVFVNRVWQHLFGEGLVRTPDNFGTRGQPPTHPELLDFLASEFMADGWSVKRLVRKIVLSRVYQLSSKPHHTTSLQRLATLTDPENRLLWRQNRRRLDAEAMRDAMLAVSGRVDWQQFGDTLTYTGRIDTPASDKKTKNPAPWHRRSVYLPRYRGAYEHDLLKTFDAPHPALVTGHRNVTNVPTQALFLLNSPFVMEQALCVATDTDSERDVERVQTVYRRILGRDPTRTETEQDLLFIGECHAAFDAAAAQDQESNSSERAAWASLCQTLMASNEFLFLD